MGNEKPLVHLGRNFTQVQMTEASKLKAVDAAYWVTCSPHEWEWTIEQQAAMAHFVLWSAQRLEAMKQLASGSPLLHEPEEVDR